MAQRKLEPSEWKDFFDDFSKRLPLKLVEIEVASLDVGDQDIAEWVVLEDISYDHRDKSLSIRTTKFEHVIEQPEEIIVDEDINGINYIAVIDKEGQKQLVNFKEGLKLPSPAAKTPRAGCRPRKSC
jgi:hypothetical protein